MNTKPFLTLLLLFLGLSAVAQQAPLGLYMPLEFQKAYRQGTRQMDGSVSPSYWQNRSEYRLKAKVDPYRKLLQGEGHITYHNNSPDSLREVVFHTYHDVYKAGRPKARNFGPALISEGVVLEKLVLSKENLDLKDQKRVAPNATNYTVQLSKPLPPKSSLEIEVSWHYTIPGKGFQRSGATDSTSMFIAYWYPEMSVKDDIDGWDKIVYDGGTEFYHDYSDYEVEIEVPGTFLIWASVAPNNEAEVYPETIRQRLAEARKSEKAVTIISEEDLKNKLRLKSGRWKYSAKNFPDFAFALSDHYVWEASRYEDAFGEYFLNTAYNPANTSFSSVIQAQKEALKIFTTIFRHTLSHLDTSPFSMGMPVWNSRVWLIIEP
jgi:hypothetical protein